MFRPLVGTETVPNQRYNEFQQVVRLNFFREILKIWKVDREPCERIKNKSVLYSWHSSDEEICWKCAVAGKEADLLMTKQRYRAYLNNMTNELNAIIPSVQRKYASKYTKDCMRLSAEYNKLTALYQEVDLHGCTPVAVVEENALLQNISHIQQEVLAGEYIVSWKRPWVVDIDQEEDCLVFRFYYD